MAHCSVQDVCPVLPDTQGIYDKNHPAALGACMCQSKLISALMAWESARSSCIKLCIHMYVHVCEQERLPKCSAIQINIRSDCNRSFSSSVLALLWLLLLFLHHFLLQSGCFVFSHNLKYKSCQGFLCTGPRQG